MVKRRRQYHGRIGIKIIYGRAFTKSINIICSNRKRTKKLGDFENYAFEVYRNGIPFVLRITHSSHRTKDQIESELDWLNFLSNQKIDVCRALPSINENYVEALVSEDTFFTPACLKRQMEKMFTLTILMMLCFTNGER